MNALVTPPFPREPKYGRAEKEAVQRLLDAGRLSDTGRGPATAAVEDAFAQLTGTAFALSFNSGTASLHAAVHATGAQPDIGVALSPFTWISAITSAFHGGSFPVFCDLQPGTHHLCPQASAAADCSAVMVTHAYGTPAPMELYRTDVPMIEDCSHAHGAVHAGRPVGAWGAAGCFSVQESKSVSGGEGGILTTSDRKIYEGALLLGHHPHRLADIRDPELALLAGTGAAHKFRMPTIAAAIAAEQVRALPARMAAAEHNLAAAEQIWRDRSTPLTLPAITETSKRGWYGLALTIDPSAGSSNHLFDRCAAAGVPVRKLYDDWLTSPLLQSAQAVRRFWPHVTDWRPPDPREFPHYYQARKRTLLIKIPTVAAGDYMQQVALAIDAALTRIPATT